MSALTNYFFASKPAVVRIQLLEISHPNFDTTYRLCRNPTKGLFVTHEDATLREYLYMPMQIRTMGSAGNLNQELEVTFGDLGTILAEQLQNVRRNNGMQTKPLIVYREYASSDLTAPMFGPFTLNVNNITFNKTGAVFTAKPAAFNLGRTGEVYDLGRFPMLQGFV